MPTDLPTAPYPDDETFRRIGRQVFAALTEADRATLKDSIEGAIRAARDFDGVEEDEPLLVPEGPTYGDWLAALYSTDGWDSWIGPVDDACMIGVCGGLGRAKTRSDESKWGRIVDGAFDDEAHERVERLYDEIPLGSSVRWL